jgi:Mg-chelatase subunit ChlD
MAQSVPDHAGRQWAKNEIAREALERVIQVTDDWHRQHADATLYLGMMHFNRSCSTILPMAPFDAAQAAAAVGKSPPPGDGTAIGLALAEGFKALCSTGCIRKHLVCITDGENTVGTPPDAVARQLYSQTKGDVEIHFIAFDTSARQFAFLKDVNGSVVEAADGKQLQAQLVELYEKRILVEALPAEKE